MRYLLLAVLLVGGPARAQEAQLIATLKSGAPLAAKAGACRELARVGTRRAVPVLASLLLDEQLSHMARYALEPIADPSVDAALRGALSRTKGALLAGVISSIGVRKDRNALPPLARCLSHSDPTVVRAAARALGSIGGAAAPALTKALSTASAANRPAICEGLLRCADSMAAPSSTAIYDRLRGRKSVPEQVRVAALWGAIRGRGRAGVPLLVKAIRSDSRLAAAGAVQISMAIRGPELTRALAAELAGADQAKRLLLVLGLGNRGDAGAAPYLEPLARRGPADLRVAAIHSLVQLHHLSSLRVLVALVDDAEPTVAGAARAGLVGFPGKAAESAIVALLAHPSPRTRVAAADLAVQRRLSSAVPALLRAAGDRDASVAAAGFRALGELAGPAEVAAIVEAMLRATDVAAAETALTAICARQPAPAACADRLLPGFARATGEPRLALLRVLGATGGPRALDAVTAASTSADQSLKEAALRALCDWPTADALPALAGLARTATDAKTKVLALRGLLRLIPLQDAPNARKLAQMEDAIPMIERKEERIQALAVLGGIPNAESLALISPYLTGGDVAAEAGLAAVSIAEKIVANYPADVAEVLRLIRTSDAALTARVQKVLSMVPSDAVEAGFTRIFNGKDLSGWDGKPGWWTVVEGAITAESTPEKPCAEPNYLIWRAGKPGDFELRAGFKLSTDANSGIQIRSEERPNWDTYGYQADMTGDGALVGFVYHHSRGLIAGRGERATFAGDGKKSVEPIGDPARLLEHFRTGDWNTYRVVCRGPDIALYINGVLMCRITDHHATEAAARGIIALQMHPGPPMKVQFKDIRIKELK